MNKELIMALDALEKENGIDKEIMFAAIEKSLMDERIRKKNMYQVLILH